MVVDNTIFLVSFLTYSENFINTVHTFFGNVANKHPPPHPHPPTPPPPHPPPPTPPPHPTPIPHPTPHPPPPTPLRPIKK